MKKILSILCAATLCATSVVPVYAKTASTPNADFDTFLREDFKETMEDDYTTMHS
ncbi:lipoprotein, partial [Absicoccus porci]